MGDELGRSRLVCAMHYPRDVAAGDELGRAVFQAAAAQPACQAARAAPSPASWTSGRRIGSSRAV